MKIYAASGLDIPMPEADHWYWQVGNRWVAVIEETEKAFGWFDDVKPADRPNPATYPINELPPSGELVFRIGTGQEVTIDLETLPAPALPDPEPVRALTADETHVLLDAISMVRNPEVGEPWRGYESGPADDPKADEAGWYELLNSADIALSDILGSIPSREPEDLSDKITAPPVLDDKGEVVLELASGWSLRSGVYNQADPDALTSGEYVRLCRQDGSEHLYWDQEEWQTDPALVMGAIINAAITDPE